MITTTKSYKDMILSDERIMKMKIIINDHQEIDGHYLKNVTIHEVSNGLDTLTIGSICTNSIKVTLFDPGHIPYENGSIEAFIGLELTDGIEWVPMGTFIISEVTRDNVHEVTLEGYDLSSSLNKDYMPGITYPALLKDVIGDIAMQCNIELKDDIFDVVLINEPMEVSCKEMLSYMSSLMGKNARINRHNELEFFWYQDNEYFVSLKSQYEQGLKKKNSLLTISSLTSGDEENTLTCGSGQGISFANPYMTHEILDSLYLRINGFSYTPCSLKWRGDPSIEVIDILTVEDTQNIKMIIMDNTISFDGGMNSSIDCDGQTEKEVVMEKKPTEIKLKKLYHTLIKSYKEITEKILGHTGGYYVVDTDDMGYPSGWTIMDTPTLRDDTHLWKMSMGGFGYSEDGGKTFKNFAFDLSGNFTANAITTGSLQGEKFELDLETGFIRIGNRNDEGVIDDIFFSFDENGLYLRSLSDINDRIDKNASNIAQINLNIDGIKTLVKDVQETLVTVKNYFLSLLNIKPIIVDDSMNSYEIVNEKLILQVVEPGTFEFYSLQNFIDSFSKTVHYSFAIDMNLLCDNEEDTELIHLIVGNKATDVTITSKNNRYIIENISFLDNETCSLSFDNGLRELSINKLDLIEGETYSESRIGLQEISTQVNQSGNTIEFVKKGLEQIQDDLGNYVTQQSLDEYIKFDEAKITLGKSDSAFSTVISNTKMSFYDGKTEVAFVSNNVLHITDAIINQSLTIGKFSWKPRKNGNLSLVKIK